MFKGTPTIANEGLSARLQDHRRSGTRSTTRCAEEESKVRESLSPRDIEIRRSSKT